MYRCLRYASQPLTQLSSHCKSLLLCALSKDRPQTFFSLIQVQSPASAQQLMCNRENEINQTKRYKCHEHTGQAELLRRTQLQIVDIEILRQIMAMRKKHFSRNWKSVCGCMILSCQASWLQCNHCGKNISSNIVVNGEILFISNCASDSAIIVDINFLKKMFIDFRDKCYFCFKSQHTRLLSRATAP